MVDDIITKRLRYFTNQFMEEADFTDEQSYLLNRRYLQNHLLHTPGIATGLQVRKTDAKEVTISSGVAINKKGQELVLLQEKVVSINEPAETEIYISIHYVEGPTDRQSADQAGTETRMTEGVDVPSDLTTDPQDDEETVLLARFTLDELGNVPGNVNDELDGEGGIRVRKSVGSVLADDAVSVRNLKKELRVDESFSLPAGGTESRIAFDTDQDSPGSAFLLVYAYSTDPQARFSWTQEYQTDGTSSNFTIRQVVVFKNDSRNDNNVAIPINVTARIYAVLED